MMNKYSKDLLIPLVSYSIIFLALLQSIPFLSNYIYLLLLVLPILDPYWKMPNLRYVSRSCILFSLLCIFLASLLLIYDSSYIEYFFSMLVLTALPEEWFFRAYLLSRIGLNFRGNVIVSIAFSLLHGFNQNFLMIFLVFAPSLAFGWVYQQTKSIYITVLLHALSNLVYVIFIKDIIA